MIAETSYIHLAFLLAIPYLDMNRSMVEVTRKHSDPDWKKTSTHKFKLKPINFTKVEKTTDPVFDKQNTAITTILNDKTKKAFIFNNLKKAPFDTIEMKSY